MDPFQDFGIQAAETFQTAHINRHPDIEHDAAPQTSIDRKQLVELNEGADAASGVDEDEIPVSLLRPTPRRAQMPPLPDMRFEQSYLASIKDATGWQGVAFITIRDQVLMPLVQGLAWTLILSGWRHWNSSAQYSGQSMGAKIRRWWWGVNNWKIPDNPRLRSREKAHEVKEYFTGAFATAGSADA
ncbi:hypothetical protein LTR62_008020 [Meristemomyces frigidus]|uniref:DUF1770-domain-containing protein n=1 Tax=Meristemomyces frigidus TaxID=1508187 RepID=A0AAN7YIR8_9PEZI|nr:hypothetical protein LTR62_008020 [Meristemomyces frigidus]